MKKGETNEIAETGMGRDRNLQKNAISKGRQGQKKNNSSFSNFFFFTKIKK